MPPPAAATDPMPCFVINMDGATDRWRHVEREFGAAKIAPIRFQALTAAALPRFPRITRLYEQLGERWTPGETGCLLSHLSLWQKIVQERIPRAAIFEDDVLLGMNLREVLAGLALPDHPAILKLETYFQRIFVTRQETLEIIAMAAHGLRSLHVGAAGYVLNLHAATELVNIFVHEISLADVIPFSPSRLKGRIDVHQLIPALVMQERFLPADRRDSRLSSTLEAARRAARLEVRRPLPFRIVLKLGRMARMLVKLRQNRCVVVPFLDSTGSLYLRESVREQARQRGLLRLLMTA